MQLMRLGPLNTLQAPCLDVMNFLNEVTLWYPEAISFAPGRPAEQLFHVQEALAEMARYVAWLSPERPLSPEQETALFNRLGQYQKTNGIINELICRFLEQDEGIRTTPEAIMLTDGCQEGMIILLAGLFEREHDVLLVLDPTYTGIAGSAAVLGIEMHAVPNDQQRLDLDALAAGIASVRAAGKRPRALYVTPDFHNPLGLCFSLADRQRLLELAQDQEMLLIEDNAYGMLAYDEVERLPTLKALDRHGVVIYLGTFSKVLFPGLRLGLLVADQKIEEKETLLAAELSKVKSFTTVTTSAISQAIAGGILLKHACSLRLAMKEKVAFYQQNRDTMLHALETCFAEDPLLAGSVTWKRPGGGFFLTIHLPMPFTGKHMEQCAQQYGVICCPMTFFSVLGRCQNQVRLSFSSVSPAEISTGVQRFHQFVHDQVAALT
ncbi:MAG TPA: PLP-dependent aminotransferase family protein [Ktedonobacteraceae bacterium]|jgi:(S)-3,5-dihydroxyphenylglycine transaminase